MVLLGCGLTLAAVIDHGYSNTARPDASTTNR